MLHKTHLPLTMKTFKYCFNKVRNSLNSIAICIFGCLSSFHKMLSMRTVSYVKFKLLFPKTFLGSWQPSKVTAFLPISTKQVEAATRVRTLTKRPHRDGHTEKTSPIRWRYRDELELKQQQQQHQRLHQHRQIRLWQEADVRCRGKTLLKACSRSFATKKFQFWCLLRNRLNLSLHKHVK